MSPPLWPPSSWLSSRHPGPEPLRWSPGMDRLLVNEINRALRLTIQVHGWPDTYGRRPPEVRLAQGDGVVTVVLGDGSDPFHLLDNLPVRILVGDRFLDTPLAQALLHHGFSREQVLVQTLSHEAYHSNEGQHLQRGRIPLDLFRTLFVGAFREQFPEHFRQTILGMAQIAKSVAQTFERDRTNQNLAQRLKVLYGLHTKIDEGAADVHSMVVFHRLFPSVTMDYLACLAHERRHAREQADRSLSMEAFVEVYDNASCLEYLLGTQPSSWPATPLECTVFALTHAAPFLAQHPGFRHLQDGIERMAKEIHQVVRPASLTMIADGTGATDRPESSLKRRRSR